MLTAGQRINVLSRTDDPWEILKACGAYYCCPKDAFGKRLGPLVGYAGTYESDKHWVGDAYVNFAQVERYPRNILQFFVRGLSDALDERGIEGVNVICGAFMGGIAVATCLAYEWDYACIYPEKKVIALATAGGREQSEMVFGRHEVEAGERVLIVDDVLNNFSTTAQLVSLIREQGGIIIGIAGILNRSPIVDTEFVLPDGTVLPVVSFIHRQIPEYRQDDPAVVEDVARGNVVWKPKPRKEWARLMAAVEAANFAL